MEPASGRTRMARTLASNRLGFVRLTGEAQFKLFKSFGTIESLERLNHRCGLQQNTQRKPGCEYHATVWSKIRCQLDMDRFSQCPSTLWKPEQSAQRRPEHVRIPCPVVLSKREVSRHTSLHLITLHERLQLTRNIASSNPRTGISRKWPTHSY